MKFISLFKKELREMVTVFMLIGVVLMLVGFSILGSLSESVIEDAVESSSKMYVHNLDKDSFISDILVELKKNNVEIIEVDVVDGNYQKALKDEGISSLLVIPENFSQKALSGETVSIETYNIMKGTSMLSNISSDVTSQYANMFSEAISAVILSQKLTVEEILQVENPVVVEETTIVGEKSTKIALSQIANYVSSQTAFVPIIVFLLVIYSSQMIISAISTEKIDKTLETLLSAPVSRGAVLSAKMLAAGVVAGVYAIVFMYSVNGFTNGMMSDVSGNVTNLGNAINELGIALQPVDYFFVGIQLFLSILIALSISLILGALAKDVKSAQTVALPMIFMVMIPYSVSMLTDINNLSFGLKTIINLIPFTHTFTVFSNLMMGNITDVIFGIIYQLAFLFVCMFFAIRVFMSDKIFTISLNFGARKKLFKAKKLR